MFEDETKLIITIQLILGVFIYGKGVASSHFIKSNTMPKTKKSRQPEPHFD